MRELNLHVSFLGGRVGHGLEQVVKEIMEEFAGQALPHAERLVLRDETGVHYRVGAGVEREQRAV